ncbi:testis-specific serine/threonine-protein kinase 1 [Microplitis demolitor]|uniref:testis-specific serine/threonine-protein kinase 1 n=1 Tax=Microplitis demolitor TaxID=69319 RepID=UPI00235B6F89|nr:testis-specific serine/threonine-protein kinase 1 [Microplitis demolitor]
MFQEEINQSSSEETTLKTQGYKILKKLGEGSFAKVFLAEYKPDSEPDSKVNLACKIVDTSKAPKEVVQKFFPRELSILMKLNHPHVVQVHSIFQRNSKYFIFMRFAESGDLLEYITKNGSVGEIQARIWLRQLTLGLQYLHEMEIAHRDMKCENVLLTINFNVKLADFGFARYVTDIRGKQVLSDTYCGSLLYAAPEILRGSPYNPKIADIWSLGVILYIIINKAMPFDDTNLTRLYTLQTNRRWKFQQKVIDQLSDQVKKLIACLLEPDTAKRWKVNQIVQCSWIAMNPELVVLKPIEQEALNSAIDNRKKNAEEMKRKKTILYASGQNDKEGITNVGADIGDIKVIKKAGEARFISSIVESNIPNFYSVTTE